MASAGQCVFLALCLLLCIVKVSTAEPQSVYDIDLREQSVADALTGLSEQTGVPVIFPYDLVKDRSANPVSGRYTLMEALDALLRGTGLSGGLSYKGVLTISQAKSGTNNETETMTQQDNSTDGSKSRVGGSTRVAALATAIAAASSVSAQAVNNDSSDMENVVITAQKRSERLLDVPVPVTALDAEALSQNDQVLLRDYYASVPGLLLSPNVIGAQTLAIRGITTGGFTIPTIGVMVDDSPVLSAIQPVNQVPEIDPGDLARVEVLRGPQGTLYGANTMGGLIKFVTKDPSPDEYSGRIEAGTSRIYNGPDPGYNLRGSANIPLSSTAAIRVSGFTRQDPGYVDDPAYNLTGLGEGESYGGRVCALWQPSGDFSTKFNAMLQHDSANDNTEVYKLPGLGDLQNNEVPESGAYWREVQLYSATINYKAGSADLTSVTSYLTSKQRIGLDDSSGYGYISQQYYGVGGFDTVQLGNLHKVSQELRLTLPLGKKFQWLLGGFYTQESVPGDQAYYAANAQTGQIVALEALYRAPSHYREYSGFTDLTYHITDRLDLQIGGRESSFRETSLNTTTGPLALQIIGEPAPALNIYPEIKENAVTYLLSPSFKISPDVLLYARIASGFRPGGANFPGPGVPIEFNPDKTKNYEIGLKGDFLDRAFSLDASVYYVDWNDIQINLTSALGNSYNANGGRSKSDGVELSATSRPVTGLSISAWFDYDDAVLTQAFPASSTSFGLTGDRLPLSSRYSGNLSLDQRFVLSNRLTGFIGATASYVGDRIGVFTQSEVRQTYPAYTKTDLHAGVEDDSWTLNLYVNNVADVRGELSGGIGYYHPFSFIYITPRTVGMSLTKVF